MTTPTPEEKPATHFIKWMPITNVTLAEGDEDTNVPALDLDLPGGARKWRLRDVAGNVYKGRRTKHNKTGWCADFTNQPLSPSEYASLEDTEVGSEDDA